MRRLLIAAVIGLCSGSADARPAYLAVYKETFRDHLSVAAKCQICHSGDRKSIRNDYGKRFEAKLSGKNVKDAEEIRRILRELGPVPARP
ncbi:MAG TPA: hypothetical protein VM165_06055 [Planctomycetaceae bacterium]|nr:hypothetical protein [Planctomycetaceae bacterium]